MMQKIREEIERRLKDYWEICFHDVVAFNEDSNVRELKELLAFIRTLEESEKPINPVDFDKAWEEYGKSKGGGAITVNVKDLARHFYELGRGHSEIPNNHEDLDEAAEKFEINGTGLNKEVGSVSIYDAFKSGAEWAFGQGVTVDGCITKIGNDCYLDIDGDQEQRLSVFDNEEEVIVQIRKK